MAGQPVGKYQNSSQRESSLTLTATLYKSYNLTNKGLLDRIQCNSKRTDIKEQMQHKLKMRKHMEATISNIKKLFSRTIHAVTLKKGREPTVNKLRLRFR